MTIKIFRTIKTNKTEEWATLKKLMKDTNVAYESIEKDKYIRPYFDIEKDDCDATKEERNKILQNSKKWIKEHFENSKLSISETKRPNKISYHILINNYKTTTLDMINFKNQNNEEMKKVFIDPSVYRNGMSKFRCVKMKKEGQDDAYTKEPINYKDDLNRHLVQLVDDDAFIFKFENSKEKKEIKKETKVKVEVDTEDKAEVDTEDKEDLKEDEIKIKNELVEDKKLFDNNNDHYDTWLNKAILFFSYFGKEEGLKKFLNYSRLSTKHQEKYSNDKYKEISERYNYNKMPRCFRNYKIQLELFNQNNFKIRNPVCYCEVLSDKQIIKRTQAELKDVYSELYYIEYNSKTNKFKKFDFIQKYLKDENKIIYNSFDFIPPPLICPTNIYNTWTGYKSECQKPKITDEQLNLLLYHIKVLSNFEEKVSDYLIKYIAHMVQLPAIVPEIAILFKSAEGAGKGTLIELLKKLLGDEFIEESADPKQNVFNKFSTKRIEKIVILIDETNYLSLMGYIEILKNAITSTQLSFEEKNKKSMSVNNTNRFILATNNDNPFSPNPSDRRFILIKCSDKHIGDKEYFDQIYDLMNDKNVMAGFFQYFKNIDLTNFKPSKDRPITEYYNDVKSVNIPPLLQFLEDFIFKMTDDQKEITVATALFYYKKFCTKYGIKNESMNNIKLSLLIKNHYSETIILKRTKEKRLYIINRNTIFDFLKKNNYTIYDSLDEGTNSRQIEEDDYD